MFLQKVGIVQPIHMSDVEMSTQDVIMHDEQMEKDLTLTLVRLKKLKLSLLSDIVRLQVE